MTAPEPEVDQWIVVFGNPVNGFVFIGPFPDEASAVLYAEGDDDDWWVARLAAPPPGGQPGLTDPERRALVQHHAAWVAGEFTHPGEDEDWEVDTAALAAEAETGYDPASIKPIERRRRVGEDEDR